MFNFSISNFRSFLDQDLNFSRINILIGENNAGKSSLLKFLLALKQSFQKPDELNLNLSGEYVDLGNYKEVIYYKSTKKNITFSFEFDKVYFNYFISFITNYEQVEGKSARTRLQNKLLKFLGNYVDSKTKISFTLTSNLSDHSTIKTVIENNQIGKLEIVQKKGKRFKGEFRRANIKYDFGTNIDTLEDCAFSKDAFLSLVNGDIRAECKNRYGAKGDSIYYKIAFLLVTQNYLRNEIDKFEYVNPVLTSPKRIYFQEDKKATYQRIDIEKFINIIGNMNSKDRISRLRVLNKYVKNLGIADEVKLIINSKLHILALEAKTKDLWSNITDVGYGVSLQLPILFQALISELFTRSGETLLIEQPEVHLHPNLQAKFIENLLSIGKNNKYFIETHSEHIIRKLQLMVKNKEFQIEPSDITIHYFKRETKHFNVSSHTINKDGILSPEFPPGFYDVSYNLVKEML